MRIFPFDEMVAVRAIALRQKRKVGLADAIIAATALVVELSIRLQNPVGDLAGLVRSAVFD
jgi:predicted nucleic acid-binding protein